MKVCLFDEDFFLQAHIGLGLEKPDVSLVLVIVRTLTISSCSCSFSICSSGDEFGVGMVLLMFYFVC